MLVRSIKPRGFSRRDTIFPRNACRGYTPGTLEAVAPCIVSTALVGGGALCIALRWRRSPQAYRTIIVVAVGYFVTGARGRCISWLRSPFRSLRQIRALWCPQPPFPAATAVSHAAAGTQPDNLPNRYSGKVVGVTDGHNRRGDRAGGRRPERSPCGNRRAGERASW